ncbi:MAG: WG repeat-containing protein [Bacteroidales bacterium]|nr:WG repeat-containing protein [Bacteroidales bacterium]
MSFKNFFENDNQYRYFKSKYEDVSEPLYEYRVNSDRSLTLLCEPTLLGVKKGGKWGWVNENNEFVIPPIYDHGFVICYDGIIVLEKNGYYGGLYRATLTTAFQFKYDYLSHMYNQTYLAQNSSGLQALVKPGDIRLTDYKYIGFKEYIYRSDIATYVRRGFFGNEVSGNIDLETGRELT